MSGRWIQIGPARLYSGDWRDVEPEILQAAAVVTDPPYGIGYEVRARNPRGAGLIAHRPTTGTPARAPIVGDDQPFDPSPFTVAKRAFCGAHHYADRLPPGGSWLVWDKREGSTPDRHADGDTVWLSVPGALRIHRQKWRGIVRAGEENCSRSRKLHPNQKPVALLARVLELLDLRPGELVGDPFMGSGSTAIAVLRRGGRFVGAEIDEQFFAVAAARIAAEVERAAA